MALTESNMSDYIYNVLVYMEGASNPYQPAFPLGNSGLSFGQMQNDAHTQGVLSTGYKASTLLAKALSDYGVDSGTADSIVSRASTAGVSEGTGPGQINPDEVALIQAALQHDAPLVAAQDAAAAQVVVNYVKETIDAAQDWPQGPGVLDANNLDPTAVALLAAWYNRTGAPTNIIDPDYPTSLPNTESTGGLTVQDIENYLSHQTQFTHESFASWLTRVDKAAIGHNDLLASMINAPNSWFQSFAKHPTPIVLDLNGDGVTTLTKDNGVYFDIENTGFAMKTGWAAPTDGFLVWDRNGNGLIDNSGEMFGSATLTSGGTVASNGFLALASYDSNHDGVINASDPIWSNLKIWVDANSNGVTDPGELHSLSSLGIAGLNLDSIPAFWYSGLAEYTTLHGQ